MYPRDWWGTPRPYGAHSAAYVAVRAGVRVAVWSALALATLGWIAAGIWVLWVLR